ncbi:hypothetical protein AOZ06_07160 [Kibdelosporangium phytohabitans]|uniref:Uncharacterized protein n=2 Tax=Kibdelosporangium phytohabitans TaxID=860235 RepID=A0A0N9HXE3_9PSEU|nr:hypothetical protein AOZ06_07160 [Kibdelosporangium phytohabitans]
MVGSIALVGLLFPATAQAQAACVWQRAELPVPAGHGNPAVKGVGGAYTVALTRATPTPGIVRWHNGQPALLGSPAQDATFYGAPRDVSANGTVLADLVPTAGPPVGEPYVTLLDGTHKPLGTPSPGQQKVAVAINAGGDVVGYTSVDGVQRLVVWHASDYSKPQVLGAGDPAGIDDAGFILAKPGIRYKQGEIAKPLKKPAGATQIQVHGYDNNTAAGLAVIGDSFYATVWNADGTVRHVMSTGKAQSANSQGTVLNGGPIHKLWRAGQEADLPVPGPANYTQAFVTERDTVVGNYRDDVDGYAAEWTCG